MSPSPVDVDTTVARQPELAAHALKVAIEANLDNGSVTAVWQNKTGEPLVTQTITTLNPDGRTNLKGIFHEGSATDNSPLDFQIKLAAVNQDPNLRIETEAHRDLLTASAAELVELIDSGVYFIPPAKARDGMLGTLSGGALLSTTTLPVDSGNWALISIDVVGLGRADKKAGDYVLSQLAPLFQKHFGDDIKLFARDGGDEFVALVRTQETGSEEVLKTRLESLKKELSEPRIQAKALVEERAWDKARIETLMRNAFRQDLHDWHQSTDGSEKSMKGFVEFLINRNPELANSISIDNWPTDPKLIERRTAGVLVELFSGSSLHYFRKAKELDKFDPLLDIRASVTCFEGPVTPKVMQQVRAQNNYEIDKLKNRPDAPVVVSTKGVTSAGAERNFIRRTNEIALADAIAKADEIFITGRQELTELAARNAPQEAVFEIACKLARATFQDAQYPTGSRYSLGAHLLVGHLLGEAHAENIAVTGAFFDLKDAGRINNWLSPEKFDALFQDCCRVARVARPEHEFEPSIRISGGGFWQITQRSFSTENLETAGRAVSNTYHDRVWRDLDRARERHDIVARLERLGLSVLNTSKANVDDSFLGDFPRIDIAGPATIKIASDATVKEMIATLAG